MSVVELELLRQRNEAAKLKRDTALLEAEALAISGDVAPGMVVDAPHSINESWGDLVDPGEWRYDDNNTGRPSSMVGAQLGDRADGRNIPFYWNEQDLAAIRAMARILGNRSSTAGGIKKNLTNYVMGTGFKHKVGAREGLAENKPLIVAVQAVVNEFLIENNWAGDRDRELFWRSIRDGEFFLSLCHVGHGHVQSRIIEPEQVCEPSQPDRLEDQLRMEVPSSWSFGVHTDDDDLQDVHGYWVRTRTQHRDTGRYYPADVQQGLSMMHFKRNVDTNIKRGMSDFYPVYELIEGAGKLAINTVTGAAVISAIAAVRQYAPGTTRQQVETMQQSNAWQSYRQSSHENNGKTRYVGQIKPGTILDMVGHQYAASPLATQGAGRSMSELLNGGLRMVGSNWCMPDWMISGSTGTTAYSAAMVGESPFVKNCEAEQHLYVQCSSEILWRVILMAHNAGRFDHLVASFGDLHGQIDLKIEPPRVAAREADKETNRNKILHDSGVLSPQTWAERENIDYEEEAKRGAKKAAPNTPPGFGVPGQPQPPNSTPIAQDRKPQSPLEEHAAGFFVGLASGHPRRLERLRRRRAFSSYGEGDARDA